MLSSIEMLSYSCDSQHEQVESGGSIHSGAFAVAFSSLVPPFFKPIEQQRVGAFGCHIGLLRYSGFRCCMYISQSVVAECCAFVAGRGSRCGSGVVMGGARKVPAESQTRKQREVTRTDFGALRGQGPWGCGTQEIFQKYFLLAFILVHGLRGFVKRGVLLIFRQTCSSTVCGVVSACNPSSGPSHLHTHPGSSSIRGSTCTFAWTCTLTFSVACFPKIKYSGLCLYICLHR